MASIIIEVVILVLVLEGGYGWRAGIYVENGRNQTTIDHDLTEEEKMLLELEILHVLGLPTKPTKIRKSLGKSTLKYLMEMYQFLNGESKHRRSIRSPDGITLEKQMTIEDSDVIMTFDSTSDSRYLRHEKGRRIWFNIARMPVAEGVVHAELRVFQQRVPANSDNNLFTLVVYELVDLYGRTNETKFISSVTTTRGSSGWLSVNLTSWVLSWTPAWSSTKGLYVVVYPQTNPGVEMRPEALGITTTHKHMEIQPFVAVFFKNVRNFYHPRFPREVRSKFQKKIHPVSYPTLMRSYGDGPRITCTIHTLYISFKDLRWQDWIIAPEGYSAYYCAGECTFPLTNIMNASSHALVQSWMHYKYPGKFPRPACGPTETLPMYLIYQQADNAALQKRKDMVVKACGCL